MTLALLCCNPSRWLQLIFLGMEQEHQSLFHLMELSFLSAEIEAHIEPFFECILKGGC